MHAYGDSAGAPDPRALLAEWTQQFGRDGQLQRYRSSGCEKCDGTGFKGRLGLHELMIVNRDLRHLIQTNARSEELQRCALDEGMRTLRQDGIEKVLAGDTSIEEVRATSNV
jgi:type II secretory ATPase GspE/PulE/Tfp pilus assembly ATPase PilB-like protein